MADSQLTGMVCINTECISLVFISGLTYTEGSRSTDTEAYICTVDILVVSQVMSLA